jgi:hypothetical protein
LRLTTPNRPSGVRHLNPEQQRRETPNASDKKPRTVATKNPEQPFTRLYRKTLSNARARARESEHPAFEEFYRNYPRHVARGTAAKAYRKAVDQEGATPSEILAACLRFAAEREGQDQLYTPYPASWLKGQRWKDDPAEPPAPPAAPGGSGLTGFDSVIAGLAAIHDDDGGDE